MYRCETCNSPSPAGSPALRYAVRRAPLPGRQVGEIAREYKVCAKCKGLLEAGATVKALQARFSYEPEFAAPAYQGPALEAARMVNEMMDESFE